MKRKGWALSKQVDIGADVDVTEERKGHPAAPRPTAQSGGGPLMLSDVAVVALFFFGTLALYIFTLPPTVVGGDSGEIVVAAWTLAVPHPPGCVAASQASIIAAATMRPDPTPIRCGHPALRSAQRAWVRLAGTRSSRCSATSLFTTSSPSESPRIVWVC